MGRFVISPQFRLQEWVAEEKGYFRAAGLDYENKLFALAIANPEARFFFRADVNATTGAVFLRMRLTALLSTGPRGPEFMPLP